MSSCVAAEEAGGGGGGVGGSGVRDSRPWNEDIGMRMQEVRHGMQPGLAAGNC